MIPRLQTLEKIRRGSMPQSNNTEFLQEDWRRSEHLTCFVHIKCKIRLMCQSQFSVLLDVCGSKARSVGLRRRQSNFIWISLSVLSSPFHFKLVCLIICWFCCVTLGRWYCYWHISLPLWQGADRLEICYKCCTVTARGPLCPLPPKFWLTSRMTLLEMTPPAMP